MQLWMHVCVQFVLITVHSVFYVQSCRICFFNAHLLHYEHVLFFFFFQLQIFFHCCKLMYNMTMVIKQYHDNHLRTCKLKAGLYYIKIWLYNVHLFCLKLLHCVIVFARNVQSSSRYSNRYGTQCKWWNTSKTCVVQLKNQNKKRASNASNNLPGKIILRSETATSDIDKAKLFAKFLSSVY